MKRSLAGIAALFVLLLASQGTGFAQTPPPAVCRTFPQISAEAQKRGAAVGTAIKAKVDRKQICTLMNSFVTAEATAVKFLIDNQTWCGIPPQVVTTSKANHEKSLKFREVVCTEAPAPKAPTLSDAIKSTPVDSANNTKTGRYGTFDSLTGNPLGK